MRLNLSQNGDSIPFIGLNKTKDIFFDLGYADARNSYHLFLGGLTFLAFTLEAYLNHIGAKLEPEWHKIERKLSINAKLELIAGNLGLGFDIKQEPWAAALEIKNFRNPLAHGKDSFLQEACIIQSQEEQTRFGWLKTDWQLCASQERATQLKARVEGILDRINNAYYALPFPHGAQEIQTRNVSVVV